MRELDRRTADAAAAALAKDAHAAEHIAKRLGLVGAGKAPLPAPRAWLGPWAPKTARPGTAFTWKAAPTARWRWADVATIPAKSRRRRVVYLGESVARGFFFDPAITPARMLEATLCETGKAFEVVDLASNDLSSYELLCLLEGVPALRPDAIVIFAGNNWMTRGRRAHVDDPTARSEAAAAVRKNGLPALKGLAEHELAETAKVVTQAIAKKLRQLAVPSVIIVPEFNLRHWRSEDEHAAPWLAGDGNHAWWTNAREQPSKVHAKRLMMLDGGTTHRALSALAEADPSRARDHLAGARDARLWELGDQTPRCPRVVQDALRGLEDKNVHIVDLPALFAKHERGEPAGRRFFLDYCHMTKEALALTTLATAHAIVGSSARAPEAVPPHALPSNDEEAMAYFAAAVHNAHWGQTSDIFGHQLDRAAALSPKAARWLRRYVDMQGRPAPPLLTKAAGELLGDGEQLGRFLLRYGLGRSFDGPLVSAMLDRLDVDVARAVRARRGAEWGVGSGGGTVDLISPFFSPSRSAQGWPLGTRSWLRATSPRLELTVPVAESIGLRLSMTARSSAFARRGARGIVRFNGRIIGRVTLSKMWRTTRLSVPKALVRLGDTNRLTIEWSCRWHGDEALAWASSEIEAGRPFETVPAFAEIQTLTVASRS